MNRGWMSIGAVGAAGLLVSTLAVSGLYAADGPRPLGHELPPTPPPADAVVLFDGSNTDAWQGDGGKPFPWRLAEDYFEVVPGSGSAITKETFGDLQFHMQFAVPYMPEASGQGRGNSGLYFPGGVEVQILDSFGLVPQLGDCGALYSIKVPDVNATLPPEVWQTYDALYRAPRFEADGKKASNARISVVHNGIWIHHDVEIDRDWQPNGPNNTFVGNMLLQDHGNRVRFRNIWIRRL